MSVLFRAIALLLPPLALFLAATTQERVGPVNHEDEIAWIASAYYGELAFSGDFHNPDWQLLPAKDSPPVGKYAFAIGLRMIGQPVRSIEPLASWYARYRRLPGGWGSGSAYQRRQAVADRFDSSKLRGYRPFGWDSYRACRRIAMLAGMLAAAGVASIGLAIRGPVTGLTAGLAFAIHPIVVPASMLAMYDTLAIAGSIASVRLLIALVGGSARAQPFLGIGLGLSMAMAVGTKMNALIVVALAGLVLVAALGQSLRRNDRPSWRTTVWLAIAMGIGLIVFLAINPALYPDPVSGLADLFRLPAETTRIQASIVSDFLGSGTARGEAVGRLLAGFRLGLLPIAAIGLITSVWAIRKRTRAIVVAWFWLAMVLVIAWIPFPWPRYVLPVVPCGCLIGADCLVGLVERFRGIWAAAPPSQPEGESATMSGRS